MLTQHIHGVECIGVRPIKRLEAGGYERTLIFATDTEQIEVGLFADQADRLLLPEEVAGNPDALGSLPLVSVEEAAATCPDLIRSESRVLRSSSY